ncbi:NADPH dehydrogenase [Xylariales sp. PMI_506]|nr:NADPH dehydrogenase [Xylariales sp. PMI_506]
MGSTTTGTRLFEPIEVCSLPLQHRAVMAPLTRFRAEKHVMLPIAEEYYAQRACVPGTLIIAEATMPSLRHCARPYSPGIWTAEQIAGWKRIVDVVHGKGCHIVLQICAPGRAAEEAFEPLGPSPVPITEGSPVPREITEEEIQQCIADFAAAARNAVERAGFDGVEIHGANGYLIDQFVQDVSNFRTDRWGGSIENRSRFGLEVAKAVADAVGSKRVGFRVSPWSKFQSMLMKDPRPQFSHLVAGLKELDLGYLHVIESRVHNIEDVEKVEGIEFLLDIWGTENPVLVAGGFKPESAKYALDEEYAKYNAAVVFGRYFVSTPDLVFRLRNGLEPNPYDRSTFYTPIQPEGYIDYPFSPEFLALQA